MVSAAPLVKNSDGLFFKLKNLFCTASVKSDAPPVQPVTTIPLKTVTPVETVTSLDHEEIKIDPVEELRGHTTAEFNLINQRLGQMQQVLEQLMHESRVTRETLATDLSLYNDMQKKIVSKEVLESGNTGLVGQAKAFMANIRPLHSYIVSFYCLFNVLRTVGAIDNKILWCIGLLTLTGTLELGYHFLTSFSPSDPMQEIMNFAVAALGLPKRKELVAGFDLLGRDKFNKWAVGLGSFMASTIISYFLVGYALNLPYITLSSSLSDIGLYLLYLAALDAAFLAIGLKHAFFLANRDRNAAFKGFEEKPVTPKESSSLPKTSHPPTVRPVHTGLHSDSRTSLAGAVYGNGYRTTNKQVTIDEPVTTKHQLEQQNSESLQRNPTPSVVSSQLPAASRVNPTPILKKSSQRKLLAVEDSVSAPSAPQLSTNYIGEFSFLDGSSRIGCAFTPAFAVGALVLAFVCIKFVRRFMKNKKEKAAHLL